MSGARDFYAVGNAFLRLDRVNEILKDRGVCAPVLNSHVCRDGGHETESEICTSCAPIYRHRDGGDDCFSRRVCPSRLAVHVSYLYDPHRVCPNDDLDLLSDPEVDAVCLVPLPPPSPVAPYYAPSYREGYSSGTAY